MVLPRFVEAALAGRPLTVHDDGHQVRCFAHVLDVVQSVIELMATDAAVAGVFNIGSDQPVSILQLAKTVIAAVNPQLQIVFQSYADAYDLDFEDVRSRIPDLSRLRRTIQFRPAFTLESTIRDVIEQTVARLRRV
jgi:UDP-glucose 4-epimerase